MDKTPLSDLFSKLISRGERIERWIQSFNNKQDDTTEQSASSHSNPNYLNESLSSDTLPPIVDPRTEDSPQPQDDFYQGNATSWDEEDLATMVQRRRLLQKMKLLEYVFVQVDVETGELIRDEEEKEEKEEEEENNGPSTSTPPGVQRDPSAPWDTPWTEKEEKDLRIAEFRAIREARAEREKADELKNTMLNCKWWNDD